MQPKRLTAEDFRGRIRRGGYKIGPDAFGCVNTGTAPVLYHSPKHLSAGRDWLVCDAELDLREAIRHNLLVSRGKLRSWRSTSQRQRNRIWAFKSRSAAVRKFVELCNARYTENQKLFERHCELRKRALAGDVSAAILLD